MEPWMVYSIVDFLDLEDLPIAFVVCKSFQAVGTSPHLWAKFVEQLCPLPNNSRLPIEWKRVLRDFLQINTSVLFAREPYQQIIARACDASSTDDLRQSILETLNGRDSRFWSSTGSATAEADEFLTYELMEPLCFVKGFAVEVFQADYQTGAPIYPPRRTRVRLGFSHEFDQPEECCFISPAYATRKTSEVQRFMLPKWVPCHFIRFDFLGKVQTQPSDDLYYTCFGRIRVMGIPFSFMSAPLRQLAVDFSLSTPGFLRYLATFHSSDELPVREPYPAANKPRNPRDINTGGPHPLFMPLSRASNRVCEIVREYQLASVSTIPKRLE